MFSEMKTSHFEGILELKVYLVQKYLNKDYRLDDTTVKSIDGQKVEYYYLDELLFRSIDKSLDLFEPMLVFGANKLFRDYFLDMRETIFKYFENYSTPINTLLEFEKDFGIDIEEINQECLKLVNATLQEVYRIGKVK